MAATVTTKLYLGAVTGTAYDLPTGNLRFVTCDDDGTPADPGNNFPIPIPASSYYYSYAKTVAFYVTAAPDTSITNIRIYSDGASWGTGIDVLIGNVSVATYVRATGTLGTTGNLVTTFYTGITSTSSFASNISNNAYAVTSAATSGTGRYSYFVVFQAAIGTTATSGAKAVKTVTWIYDEV